MKIRLNVAAILRNHESKILIGERCDTRGGWQFPQGGVDEGETLEQALLREIEEEIFVKPEHCKIIESKGPYRYYYGREIRGHEGKDQHFFMIDFSGVDADIDLETEHPEFQAFRWIKPEEFQIDWLPEMKREVYRAVFRDFFQIEK